MRRAKSVATLRAAEWLLRIEEGSLTSTDRAEFLAWLKASPLHVREYLGVARTGRRLSVAFAKQTRSDGQHEQLDPVKIFERWVTEREGRSTINGGSKQSLNRLHRPNAAKR